MMIRAAVLSVVIAQAAFADEICRFRAGDRENPFLRWLASQEMTCVPAGSRNELPPGLWNVFVRSTSGVSPVYFSDATALPTLEPAATLDVTLPERRTGVVYLPRKAMAYPVDATTRRVTVPAQQELWLFVLEKSVPVALFPIGALGSGMQLVVDARTAGPSAVIGWVQVPESDRAALAGASGVPPPLIRASSRNADAPPPLDLLHGAFVRVPGVPAGESDLEISGRGWIPSRTRVKVANVLTTAAQPLMARLYATIVVNWSASQDLLALDQSLGGCDESSEIPQLEISVGLCPAPPQGECSVVRKETFDADQARRGSLTIENLIPGVYRAELKFGKLPPVSAVVSLLPLQQKVVWLSPSYNTIYGSVTYGGEPLGESAKLEFPSGNGFASGEKSEYTALLTAPIVGPDAQITVSACDGAPHAVVLTDQRVSRNVRYNIDIPANRLTVNVSDTFTREPLRGATVKYTVMSLRIPRRPLFNRTVIVAGDDDSQASVKISWLPEREIRISVSHGGYERQEVAPFSITKSEQKVIDVQLVPLRGSRGRIASGHLFENGAIYWYAPTGVETERAEISSDGTFVYANSHEAGETMAVVSSSHPLWVLRTPSLERRQTFQLRFPDVMAREIVVALTGIDRRRRHVGVAIGGIVVPQPALTQHQFLRGSRAVWEGAPLLFRDIAITGPIEVMFGPLFDDVPTRHRGMSLFVMPQYADSPRKAVPPDVGLIEFP